MTDTVLDILRGGNKGVLGLLRGDEETDVNREIRERIEKENAEWEAQKKQELLTPKNAVSAAAIAAGGRLKQYGSGIKELFGGEPEQTTEEISETLKPVEEAFPKAAGAATLATDVIATAPLGLGAGAGVSRTLGAVAPKLAPLAARGITGLGMGATEGAAVGLAEGDMGTGTLVGGGLGAVAEMALPPLMRKIGQVGKKLLNKEAGQLVTQSADGVKPTPEFVEALRKVGLSFDDIENVNLADLPKGMTADQTGRAALFAKQDIPTTRARITQSPEDFAGQVRLERMVGDDGADLVRTRVAEESAAIQNRLKDLSESLGVGDRAGDTIRSALTDIDSGQSQSIKNAYDALAEVSTASNASAIPLSRNSVRESIDEVLFGTKPVRDETLTAIKRAAAKYGIFGDEAVPKGSYSTVNFDGESIKFNGKQTPLNFGNFEEFRKQLNQAFQGDMTGSITSVKRALDDTVLEATEILTDVGDDRQFIQNLAKTARNSVIGRKELLDTGNLVPKLLNQNPRTGSPFVEASQVSDKIFSRGTPPEEVTRLIRALGKTEGGDAAIKNLQADTVMRLTDKAFKNAGKLQGGQTPFNITAFSNELKSIGPDKLTGIFGKNSPALKALNEFKTIGELIRTPTSAVQKGSAPDMVNALIRAGRATGAVTGDISTMAASSVAGQAISSANKRSIRKNIINMTGLNAPEAISFMTQSYPELAFILGLTTAGTKEAIEDGR